MRLAALSALAKLLRIKFRVDGFASFGHTIGWPSKQP